MQTRKRSLASIRWALTLCALFFTASVPLRAEMPQPDVDVPVPKGAEHIVIEHGDKDTKKVFDYFPYPMPPRGRIINMESSTGLYRMEVDPAGKVTAVTVLKTMGTAWDQFVMKTLTRWKAKPGGLRVVDIPWYLHHGGRSGVAGYH